MALAHGVELDAVAFGTGYLQQAQPVVVQDEAVRVVVHHHDVVPAGEVHQFLVSLTAGVGSGRHVGIVGPHEFYARQVALFQGVEVRLPPVLGFQVVVGDFLPEQFAERGIGGVARIGYQHAVAGVGQGQRDMQDAFLGTDERLYLAVRVQVHIVPPFVEISHGLAQLRNAHGGLVTVYVGFLGFGAQRLDGLWRRRHVRASDGQADDVLALGVHPGHFFQFHREIVFLYGSQPVGGLYVRVKLFVFHLGILLIF